MEPKSDSVLATPEPPPRIGVARRALLRRLIDVVALPSSTIAPQDRAMAGDVLMEMLLQSDNEARKLCAQRLVPTVDAPRRLLRFLGQCDFEVAQPLLLENESYDSADLAFIIANSGTEHRTAIAHRKVVPVAVSDALIASGDIGAVRALLRNRQAHISEIGMDNAVELSREHDELTDLIVKRNELRPSQGMAMFWWCGPEARQEILRRQSADRLEIIERCSDVFAMAAEENWADPIVRSTLQLIERRQRNRGAIAKSQFDSLEHAVEHAAKIGMTPELAQEIGFLAGIKPVTVAQILSDPGGEGAAILCKATGLRREYLSHLWKALRRPETDKDGEPHPRWESVRTTYEIMTVARAQTTLRYWNWSMSLNVASRAKAGEDEPAEESAFSATRRTARLIFGG